MAVALAPVVASLSAATLLLGGCSNRTGCNACAPGRNFGASVSATLNGARHDIKVRPGTFLHLSVTMTVSKAVKISALQLGLVGIHDWGYSTSGPCGVQTWVLQRHGAMGAGTYHFDAEFRAQAFSGSPNR
jgi:hypothetical protein